MWYSGNIGASCRVDSVDKDDSKMSIGFSIDMVNKQFLEVVTLAATPLPLIQTSIGLIEMATIVNGSSGSGVAVARERSIASARTHFEDLWDREAHCYRSPQTTKDLIIMFNTGLVIAWKTAYEKRNDANPLIQDYRMEAIYKEAGYLPGEEFYVLTYILRMLTDQKLSLQGTSAASILTYITHDTLRTWYRNSKKIMNEEMADKWAELTQSELAERFISECTIPFLSGGTEWREKRVRIALAQDPAQKDPEDTLATRMLLAVTLDIKMLWPVIHATAIYDLYLFNLLIRLIPIYMPYCKFCIHHALENHSKFLALVPPMKPPPCSYSRFKSSVAIHNVVDRTLGKPELVDEEEIKMLYNFYCKTFNFTG